MGRRRKGSNVVLREAEMGGVDALAWLESIPELEGQEADSEEGEARDWQDDYVAYREGRMSPEPDEVSELSSRLCHFPETLDELASFQPGTHMPQSVSDMTSADSSSTIDGIPPLGNASTYTLDSYYFKVAGGGSRSRSAVPSLHPPPDLDSLTELSSSLGDDDDSESDDERTTTSEGMTQRVSALRVDDGSRERLSADALRRLQEEQGEEEDGGLFVNEDSLAMLDGMAGHDRREAFVCSSVDADSD